MRSIHADGMALPTGTTARPPPAPTRALLAAVGGQSGTRRPLRSPAAEQGLLGLRKGLGLYANLRPVRPFAALLDASPLRRELIEGTDLLVVRELTGRIYFGAEDPHRRARVGPLRVQRPGDRADHAHGLQGRALARDECRQDERARDEPAVARGRDARAL